MFNVVVLALPKVLEGCVQLDSFVRRREISFDDLHEEISLL